MELVNSKHTIVILSASALMLTACTLQQNPSGSISPTQSSRPPAQATTTPTPLATPQTLPSTSSNQSPVVIIQSEATLPKSDVTNLRKKVIEPYIKYYNNATKEQGTLVTLKIENNTNAQSANTYPYKAEAIFSTGVNNGFLVSKTNGTIDWWLPECMMKCDFDEEFQKEYPEIVEKSAK